MENSVMAAVFFFLFAALFHPVVPHPCEKPENFLEDCPPFNCGKLGTIMFPFTNTSRPGHCGTFVVDDCHKEHQKIQLDKGRGSWFQVESISQADIISIVDSKLQKQLNSKSCDSFHNLSLPSLPQASFQIMSNLTFYKCNSTANVTHNLTQYPGVSNWSCNGSNIDIYYSYTRSLPGLPPSCSVLDLPVNMNSTHLDVFRLLTANFSLELKFDGCHWCQSSGGGKCPPKHEDDQKEKRTNNFIRMHGMALGIGFPAITAIILLLVIYIRHQHNRKNASPNLLSATTSNPTSTLEQEFDVRPGVNVFSYAELEEATSNFDPRNELGNGGFGTVYYGKLRNGREVAVKRLYGYGYRMVNQFINEIQILTSVHHSNLVTLYGCTAHHSRGLLLVYEYVLNGSLADHLHGDRNKSVALTWPIRMRVAIETASALAYLHNSDIIHRDVKTKNILLDGNYSVRVADFGLSRLFPTDLSYISTAPQGSPGYVDPAYFYSYRLTDKSDVFSFGVVLIELISSLPAVDITRSQHEINLATYALNRIQECAFDELIDPSLAYKTDKKVNRMTTSVAELAFLCLQQDREMRPSMSEVLKQLKIIGSWDDGSDASETAELPASQQVADEDASLKNTGPPTSANFETDECGH